MATCGKGLFTSILQQIFSSKGERLAELAFATELKLELDAITRKEHGISAFTTNPSEKALIRPEMVALGAKRRKESNGTYWLDKVVAQIEKMKEGDYYNGVIISDARYLNELKALGSIENVNFHSCYLARILENGELLGPANDEEARNNPEVEAEAKHRLKWPTFSEEEVYKAREVVEILVSRF